MFVQMISSGYGALAMLREYVLSPLLNANLFLSPKIPLSREYIVTSLRSQIKV